MNKSTGHLVGYHNKFVDPKHVTAWHKELEAKLKMYQRALKSNDLNRATALLKELEASYRSLARRNRGPSPKLAR